MLSFGLKFDNKRLVLCQTVRHSDPQLGVVVPSYGRQGSLTPGTAEAELVHCCTLCLCYLGAETDDHHKN